MPRFRHSAWVLGTLVCVVFGVSGVQAARTRPDYDFGPLASRVTDVHGQTRSRLLGPVWEKARAAPDWHLAALRPFYSQYELPAEDVHGQDYLWPLAVRRTRGNETRDRYLIFFNFKHDEIRETGGKRRYRLWLLPFYFQGRDGEGRSYWAVFPLGGTIRDFAGKDEIKFFLFPLRNTTRQGDLTSSGWLWPVFSHTTGNGVEMKRVFPFYGWYRREGDFEKKFVLWPFWTQVRYDYQSSSGRGFILFPLYGHTRLTDQETWWVLPPFFRWTRGEDMDRLYAPWPFIQYSTGMMEKQYLWPLWGHKKIAGLERTFVAWPIFWNEYVTQGNEVRHRVIVAPFFSNLKSVNTNQPAAEPRVRAQKVWPLYSYRREGEASRFRMVELWPFSDDAAVERNWAPWWSLLTRTQQGGHCDWEFLWGLYRQQVRAEGGRYWSIFPLYERYREAEGEGGWSFLKGLLGRTHAGSHRSWRVLYFFKFGYAPENDPLSPENQNSTPLR